jgi:predicted dehydrogenase
MIRIAVLGAGRWGPNLIRNFHEADQAQVVVVADPRGPRLDQLREHFPGVEVVAEAQAAIERPDVDAVVVATPTVTHGELARQALEAGKHVLVEKPITTDGDQGEALCQMAEGTGRILMVGHVFLYNPAVRAIKERLDAGDCGRLYHLSAVRSNLGPIRMDVNAAWDLAAHDISIFDYWLGRGALTASAVGGAWINPGIEDAVFLTLRYPDDVLVNVHASWLHPRKSREVTVVGDRRMLTFDDMNLSAPVCIYDKGVTEDRTMAEWVDDFTSFRASIREGTVTQPEIPPGEPLRAECLAFLEAIRTGKAPDADGRTGVQVVRTLEAIDRSLRAHGREEQVNPA